MEEGTIVHVDYELYNGETGELIETTREKVAKEQNYDLVLYQGVAYAGKKVDITATVIKALGSAK